MNGLAEMIGEVVLSALGGGTPRSSELVATRRGSPSLPADRPAPAPGSPSTVPMERSAMRDQDAYDKGHGGSTTTESYAYSPSPTEPQRMGFPGASVAPPGMMAMSPNQTAGAAQVQDQRIGEAIMMLMEIMSQQGAHPSQQVQGRADALEGVRQIIAGHDRPPMRR